MLVNEQSATIADLWDGSFVRCMFRRTVLSTISLTDQEDAVIWQYHSSSIYSVQSLYKIVTFRGVQPVYTPAVWKNKVPPRKGWNLEKCVSGLAQDGSYVRKLENFVPGEESGPLHGSPLCSGISREVTGEAGMEAIIAGADSWPRPPTICSATLKAPAQDV
ncbi:hypothetical protein ACP4OV_011603 [Aristida adscensionis]